MPPKRKAPPTVPKKEALPKAEAAPKKGVPKKGAGKGKAAAKAKQGAAPKAKGKAKGRARRIVPEDLLPEYAMPVGYLCADFVAKGLLRADLEPMTLAPGRWQCTSTDVERLLYTWSVRLRQAYDLTHLPRLGAFGVFRESFKELSFSVVLEPSPGEVLKDLFQYITGVCWYFFMKSEDFVAQVGVVFLLYLLFHCQREQRYAIPVNVEILEKVHVVRKRCMSEQILLEFPAALRYLVQEQALSVGLRASYRNLFFDKYGHLLERKALASAHGRGRAERGATHETPLPDTRAWHRMKAKEKPVEVHIPAPPDVSHLEAQLKSYEDLRDGASGAGEVDRSLSQRMKRLAEASAVFEKSVPVPTEDLEHEAKVGLGWADPQATEATDGLSHPWLDDVG